MRQRDWVTDCHWRRIVLWRRLLDMSCCSADRCDAGLCRTALSGYTSPSSSSSPSSHVVCIIMFALYISVIYISLCIYFIAIICCSASVSVASPGFVARRGKAVNLVMWHSRRTSGQGAAAAQWLIILWLMQYWSKELRVVDICISWSRRLHNTWIVGWQIYSKVN